MITEETRKKWDEKIASTCVCIENGSVRFTDKELEFIDSFQLRREKGIDLTHKQVKVLNRIYEKIN
jgi:hypothetical protein